MRPDIRQSPADSEEMMTLERKQPVQLLEELAETLRTIRSQLVSMAGSKVGEREAIMLVVEETAWEVVILRGRENSLGEERRR